MNEDTRVALTVKAITPAIYNKSKQVSAIQRAEAGEADYVPHLSTDQIRLMASVAGQNKRHGKRNSVLIKFLFDSCLRVSEALSVRPCDLEESPSGWSVRVLGKGKQPGKAAISPSMASELHSYCYQQKILEDQPIFNVSRSQAFRIVTQSFHDAGIPRPSKKHDRVGGVHILRHSGAIERLRITGNPRATQSQLRHKSALMTLRYLKTLSADESLKIQQQVDLGL